MGWSPSEKAWSIAQCLEHLCIAGERYLIALDSTLAHARERGWNGDGVSRPRWFERWLIRNLEPPPKRRFKTPGSAAPAPKSKGSDLALRFVRMQEQFREVARSSANLDLNRATLRYPFAPILKIRVGALLQIHLAHERRHLWQAENIRRAEGFPADP